MAVRLIIFGFQIQNMKVPLQEEQNIILLREKVAQLLQLQLVLALGVKPLQFQIYP